MAEDSDKKKKKKDIIKIRYYNYDKKEHYVTQYL